MSRKIHPEMRREETEMRTGNEMMEESGVRKDCFLATRNQLALDLIIVMMMPKERD